MKKNDIYTIIMIIVVATGLSYLIFSLVLFPAKKRQQKVEVVTPISKDFIIPDSQYFNIDAINPTRTVR
jgi:hypothetical protein